MSILFLRFLEKPAKSLKNKALFIYCMLGAKVDCAFLSIISSAATIYLVFNLLLDC